MVNVAVPMWAIWTFLGVFIVVLLGGVYSWFYFYSKSNTDKILFFDKNGRWSLLSKNLKYTEILEQGKKQYFLTENLGHLNQKGKALYIFNEGNAQPMAIEKHVGKWLSPESLKGVINNKLVQLMLKPSDKFTDTLLLLGAIGGMIAGLSSVVILLIQLEVI